MSSKNKNNKLITEPVSNTNLLILFLVALLALLGLVALYSASLQNQVSFFKRVVGKQLIWMIGGLLASGSVYFIRRKLIYDSAFIIYAIGIISLILPYLIGHVTAGANRWVYLGPIHFQPSEFMKAIVVVTIARYLVTPGLSRIDFKAIIVTILIALIPALMILNQPDLGTAMIYLVIYVPMLFWAGARLFHLFIIIAPFFSIVTAFNFYTFFIWIVIIILLLYFNRSKEKIWLLLGFFILNLLLGFMTPVLWNHLEPYQQNRVLTLFNVESDPQGAGYQVIQSQTAIGSGGFWGKGIGRGTQTHLKFLPEQHNDFIFSVVGEEYGFIGVIIVLLLFMALFLTLVSAAYRTRDRFASLILIGVTSILAIHVVINVAMTVGLMPVTPAFF
jgi:rod shape determining protein RodA